MKLLKILTITTTPLCRPHSTWGGWVIGALASYRRISVCALTVTLTRLSLIAINEQICNPNRRWWCCRRWVLPGWFACCGLSIKMRAQRVAPLSQSQMPQVALDTRRVVADKKMLQALCYDSMLSICSPIPYTLPLHPPFPHSYIDCCQIWQLNVDARVPAENISVASLYSFDSFVGYLAKRIFNLTFFCRFPLSTTWHII